MNPGYAILCREVTKDFILVHNPQDSLKKRFIGLVHKRWRSTKIPFRAVENVSFQVEPGGAIGIMGPNGSGKSTLLTLLAGTIPLSSGNIEIMGRVAPMIELGVGFTPDLTGEENIYLNGSLYGFTNQQIHGLYSKIVEFSGLGDFIYEPVKNYSSGMYARLGFSVAIHVEPDVLLADEILAVGDSDFQKRCLARIRELRNAGMTLVLVSHSETQVAEFCDYYIRMQQGRIVKRGPVSELVDSPGDEGGV